MSDLKCGHATADAECLGFRSERDNAAVIVRKNDQRFPAQFRLKDPLTGSVELIAVNQREHRGSHQKYLRRPLPFRQGRNEVRGRATRTHIRRCVKSVGNASNRRLE